MIYHQGPEDTQLVFTDSEWALLILMCVFSLCVCVISAMEVRHIGAPSQARGDPDLSHGQQIRRWFMYSIAAANGMRSITTLVDILYVHVYSLFGAAPGLTSQLSFTALPSLLTFTMFSLLTVYFAQLCYTVMGMPFFHVRNCWFAGNLLLYLLVLFGLFVYVDSGIVCGALATAFGTTFLVVGWFGMNVFKYFPLGSANACATGGGIGISCDSSSGTNTPNAQQVRARLLPLVTACMLGLGVDAAMYCKLFFVDAGITSQVVVNTSFIICAEILPSTVFLWVVSRRASEGEHTSLLTATVAATERLPIINWYNSVDNSPSAGLDFVGEEVSTGSAKALSRSFFRERL
jgi:hypothetical protein